jgi:alkanesulfonate monooxygenase SsuD/methylene tetrahydromethanopterin reductase-like flavin-dependent oxidoreductase (luciferase family)
MDHNDRANDARPVRLGLSIPNMADPDRLVELGVAAEESGWDGVFLWDHAHGRTAAPMPTADPWVVLGALAVRTERIRLGTTITAPARRRPQKLARETVTVDRLSGGRMVLGVGLGEPPDEYTAYGEPADRPVLAAKLDESLEILAGLWSGEPFEHHGEHYEITDAQFLPTPVQQPRIPVWASCVLPHRRPLARAARWDGVLLASLGEDGSIQKIAPGEVEEVIGELEAERARAEDTGDRPFDVSVSGPDLADDAELAELARLGVTWFQVTGWIEEIGGLADLARSGPR